MPTPEPRRLHSNLVAAGRARCMPWEKIAAVAGMDLRGLDRVIHGEVRISSAELARIAAALQVDPTWLLTGTGPVPTPGETPGVQMTACARRPVARTNPPAHVREAMDAAELERLRALADWLIALDEPGNEDRRTVALNAIIDRARQARGQENHDG